MNCKGFTLAEIIIVLFIIGLITGLVAFSGARIQERSAVAAALKEMDEIKKAVREGFYPDLGLIPEDLGPDRLPASGDESPATSTRYLCLKDDGGFEKSEMSDFLTAHGLSGLMDWDRYTRKGWRPPYMEQDRRYYDASDNVWYPVIVDSWKENYRILVERDPVSKKQIINSARIVSLGANREDNGGLTYPVPAEVGDDLVMFIFGGEPVRSPLE